MSLRSKLILTTLLISTILSVLTVGIFLFTAFHQLQGRTQKMYMDVTKTLSFIQRAVARSADTYTVKLKDCKNLRASPYMIITDQGLLVGRVENCIFYGEPFRNVIDFVVNIYDLSWFILYDREILSRLSSKNPQVYDKFIGSRMATVDYVIEGKYDPAVARFLDSTLGYKLVNNYRTLIMEVPLLLENSIPIGRLVLVKDFSQVLRDILLTPFVFMVYTLVLVAVLSSILFVVFNRIVKDIALLRKLAYSFKEQDFSQLESFSESLRKDKSRDEMYYLKRSILTMAQELESLINQLKQEKEKFEEMAYKDPLTGLSNRRFFTEEANRMIELSKRYGEPLSLIMFDIDNFKRVNDEYGHDVGDLVLKQLATVIKNNVRSSDIPARLGGEEFAILLPKTDANGALLVAERIRQDFKRSKVRVGDLEVGTTVSVGVAQFKEGDTLESLLKKADEALYEAKRTGKDKVVVAKD